MISKQTIKTYCCEDISLIEGYAEAVNSSEKYDCHHRREIADGKVLSVKELITQGLYYNRPAEELVFLKHSEHIRLHNHNCSEETRKKMAESHKGKSSGKKGKKNSEESNRKRSETMKGHGVSEETRRKLSEVLKGKPKSEEWRRNHSETMKGKNKGKKHSEKTRRKLSEAHKGRHWRLVDGKRVWY